MCHLRIPDHSHSWTKMCLSNQQGIFLAFSTALGIHFVMGHRERIAHNPAHHSQFSRNISRVILAGQMAFLGTSVGTRLSQSIHESMHEASMPTPLCTNHKSHGSMITEQVYWAHFDIVMTHHQGKKRKQSFWKLHNGLFHKDAS